MNLEDLQITLKPRRPWEAIDLGVSMVQNWWLRLFAVWFAVTLPVFVVINLVISDPFWSVIALWWLKPLFDRPLLHVLSRAVFGATPSVRETLRALPSMLRRSGLLWHLTIGRVDFARAFRLPVMQLEGLTGKRQGARIRVMSARGGGYGVGLTIICLHLESFLYFGLFVLGYLLMPQSFELDPIEALIQDTGDYQLLWNLIAYLATSLIEPFYVACGFSLYLNRRTLLEAWDLELNLRRMAARLSALRATTPVLVALVFGAVLFAVNVPDANAAIEDTPLGQYRADADPQDAIGKILADPEFGSKRVTTSWRAKAKPNDDDVDFLPPEFVKSIGRVLGAIAEGLGWALAAAAFIGIVIYLARNAGPLRDWAARTTRRRGTLDMPASVAGLDLSPETLPHDIVAGARRLWSAGDNRAALSTLYRGAIIELLQNGMALPESATEGDVLARAAGRIADDAHAGLSHLVAAWQRLAYAHRLPANDEFDTLCANFGQFFGAPADRIPADQIHANQTPEDRTRSDAAPGDRT